MSTKNAIPRLTIVISILMCITACNSFRYERISVNDENIKTILDAIDTMPNWLSLSEKEFRHAADDIKATAMEIARHEPHDVRAAFQKYLNEDTSVYEEPIRVRLKRPAKVMLISKFLFDLPERIERGEEHYDRLVVLEGGWFEKPYWELFNDMLYGRESNEIHPRWPWAEDDTGKWLLEGTFFGRSPSEYAALASFDYFQMHFPRRKIGR